MAGPPMVGSESDGIDCWENYTAGEVFVQGLAGQIHQQDVEAIIRAQKQMLQRFEKTNEMLSNCNALSASRYTLAQQEFSKHSAMLQQSKKDLDYIFKKIKNLRGKLETQYPQAVTAVSKKLREVEEEEGEDALAESQSRREQEHQKLEVTQNNQQRQQQQQQQQQQLRSVQASSTSGEGDKLSRRDSVSGESFRDSESKSAVSGGGGASGGGRGGGANNIADDEEEEDDDHIKEAIASGKVKRVSGKLHHISSSDSPTSSTKSSFSSSES